MQVITARNYRRIIVRLYHSNCKIFPNIIYCFNNFVADTTKYVLLILRTLIICYSRLFVYWGLMQSYLPKDLAHMILRKVDELNWSILRDRIMVEYKSLYKLERYYTGEILYRKYKYDTWNISANYRDLTGPHYEYIFKLNSGARPDDSKLPPRYCTGWP